LVGVIAGVGLGSYLAFNINRPIQRVTRSIQSLAEGDWKTHVDETHDSDEMRILAQTVNGLVGQLNSLEKARRQLLANLVHELGAPLGAIRSAIKALLKGADKDPQLAADLLNGLDDETARLQRLLNDLAGLQNQLLGQLELNRVEIKPKEWLAGLMTAWEAMAKDKGLSWEQDIQQELPVVMMDPDRMSQAVGNLISNAIKFTPVGGRIAANVHLKDGYMIVQVQDAGMGIPADEQEKIFQPFYRSAGGKRIHEGMGLGLSIARDIAVAHGGEITLDSAPGSGSRFTLQIPINI